MQGAGIWTVLEGNEELRQSMRGKEESNEVETTRLIQPVGLKSSRDFKTLIWTAKDSNWCSNFMHAFQIIGTDELKMVGEK